jgi:hypothetical protein
LVSALAVAGTGILAGMLLNRRLPWLFLLATGFLVLELVLVLLGRPTRLPTPLEPDQSDEVEVLSQRLRELQT